MDPRLTEATCGQDIICYLDGLPVAVYLFGSRMSFPGGRLYYAIHDCPLEMVDEIKDWTVRHHKVGDGYLVEVNHHQLLSILTTHGLPITNFSEPEMPSSSPFKVPGVFKAWFAICAVLGISATGVGIWAVIKLVHHFTK